MQVLKPVCSLIELQYEVTYTKFSFSLILTSKNDIHRYVYTVIHFIRTKIVKTQCI